MRQASRFLLYAGYSISSMPFNQVIVSRRFMWRLMIIATFVGAVAACAEGYWRQAVVFPFSLGAIIALHPLMDRNLSTFVDRAMFRERRTWICIAFLVAGSILLLFLHLYLLS